MKNYNKLVRDLIPKIIENGGEKCEYNIVLGDRHAYFLEEKLKEEVEEYIQDKNLEELADIMEVLFSLADKLGYSEQDLLRKREEKKMERGSFKEGIILKKVWK